MIEILQDPFLRLPLVALTISASICSFLAIYVILRRAVFLGAALAEMSSAGVALGILLEERYGISINLVVCSLFFVMIGVAIFSFRPQKKAVSEEGIIGTGWAIASALAILLIYMSQTGEVHMLDIVKGNPIGVSLHDIYLMGIIFIPIIIIHILFFKEFIFVSFDPETASTQGYWIPFWNLLLYITLGVVIAVSIKTIGTLLTFSYLVIPGVIALIICLRLKAAFIASTTIGIISTYIGYWISVKFDWPTSASITVTAFAFFIPALLYKLLSRTLNRPII